MNENKEIPRVEIKGKLPTAAVAAPAVDGNPLAAYYRQPKIYIKLPSGGKFYPNGSLDSSEDGTYAVYSMTAKDELMFKTPDALLSGQSTVAVINSCMPSIKDPWHVPTIDLDAILVGIRIATYGDRMDIDTNCPKCSEEQRYEFNLTQYLEDLARFQYIESFQIGDLTFHIRPYTYREFTKKSLARIEQEKIYNVINDKEMSEEEKVDRFGASFVKLTELTVESVADVVKQIDTPQGSERDAARIKQFILNASKDVFEGITQKLNIMKASLDLKVKNAKCDKCEHTFEINVTMDQADFFEARS
jgi:hypothetical protein